MAASIQIGSSRSLRKALLICGILAAIVWVGSDIAASLFYPGYNPISQATSELFAIGAPTSSLVVTHFTIFDFLLIAFSLGVWMYSKTAVSTASRKSNRALRITAAILVGEAACGLILWPFFPMHMRGDQATFTDTMHLAITSVSVPLGLLAIVFGASALGNRFLYFSIAAIAGLVLPGILGLSYAPQVVANEPTPWLGLLERIAQYVNALWFGVFAIVLLDREKILQVARSPNR